MAVKTRYEGHLTVRGMSEADAYERGKGRWWLPWAFGAGMVVVYAVLRGCGL